VIGFPASIFAFAVALNGQMPPVQTPAPATPFPGTSVTPLPEATGSRAPGTPPPTTAPREPATATPSAPPPAASATPEIVYGYRFVPRQPDHVAPGAPQIFAIYLNSKSLVSRGPIDMKVLTDPGTVKVTSGSGGRQGEIPRIAPGDFEATSTLPKIPFIAAGMTVQLQFIATGADGEKLTVKVPVTLK
jgi:hypothetical protein